MIVINGRDHLKIIAKIKEGNLGDAYKKLANIQNYIGSKIKYEIDPKLGFLCSDLQYIGSGRFLIELKLPLHEILAERVKVKSNMLVTVIKNQSALSIKGKARYGASAFQVVNAVYDVAKTYLK